MFCALLSDSWCKNKEPQNKEAKPKARSACISLVFFVVSKCNMVFHLMTSTWWTTGLLVLNGNYGQYQRSYYVIGILSLHSRSLCCFLLACSHIQSLTLVLNMTWFLSNFNLTLHYMSKCSIQVLLCKTWKILHLTTHLHTQSQHPRSDEWQLSCVSPVFDHVLVREWVRSVRGSLQVAKLFGDDERWCVAGPSLIQMSHGSVVEKKKQGT